MTPSGVVFIGNLATLDILKRHGKLTIDIFMYDVIIIGGGAAGLSAGLYAARRSLKVLILSKDTGGQTALANKIENYPGVKSINGMELMNDFKKQTQQFGAEIIYEVVTTIDKQNGIFAIKTKSNKTYESRSVILAFGKTPRQLNVPGEKEFMNKGVAYCATCDAPLFAGKDVVVVGGGNSAVDAVLVLSKIANKVHLIHRRDKLRAENVLVERIQRESNVEIIFNSVIEKIEGKDFVEQISVKNVKTETINKVVVQGIFVEIGFEVKADFVSHLVKLNKTGEVIIDEFNQTSTPGLFAAGDMTTVPFKQTVISAGEGAKAALSVYNYLVGLR